MNYVESLNLFGTSAKEIPCIKGKGAPTTETEGAVGGLYMDTLTGIIYKCVSVENGLYNWKNTEDIADQAFDPRSKNMQSGSAVDMAIKEAVEDARREMLSEFSKLAGEVILNNDMYFEIVTTTINGTTGTLLTLKEAYRGIGSSAEGYEYTISDNGVNEVGSRYYELPEMIKIPATIDGDTYQALAFGLFMNNDRIKTVVLPSGITAVSDSCFKGCKNLQSVHNTSSVTSISASAFYGTSLREAIFPNCKNVYKDAFKSCSLLKIAHFNGQGARIREGTFAMCCSLEKLTGCSKVAHLEMHSLLYTYNLKETDIGQSVTNKTVTAYTQSIQCCGFEFDTAGITLQKPTVNGTTVFTNEFCTRDDYMPMSDWRENSEISVVMREYESDPLIKVINPINKTFCQGDPKWINRLMYGYAFCQGLLPPDRLTKYDLSCVMNAFINAVFGILKGKGENLPYILYSEDDSVHTIEKELRQRFGENVFSDYDEWGDDWNNDTIPDGFTLDTNTTLGITKGHNKLYKAIQTGTYKDGNPKYSAFVPTIIQYLATQKMSALLDVEMHFAFDGTTNTFSGADAQNIHQALLEGKYVMLGVPQGPGATSGHMVLAYGIEENPDNPYEPYIWVTDTGLYHTAVGVFKPIEYKIPLRYMCATRYSSVLYKEDTNGNSIAGSWYTPSLNKMNDAAVEYPSYIIISPK